MARPLRTIIQGLTHHAYSRCINKQSLLLLKKTPFMLEQVLRDTQEKYKFNLTAYQIMDNHIHLVIQTIEGEASISRIMQYFKARFAERYNKLHNRSGPFWNERFKDQVIEFSDNPEHYLRWVVWYLAYNPVRKDLVRDPRDFPWGSINCYLDVNYKSRVKVVHHKYFRSLGTNFEEQTTQFLLYEEAYLKRLAILFEAGC
ncbi:MAG: REP-associated tyrosine transposase [Spirochaetota bacterium]